MSLGLYIHVPFCKQACSYCDFYFVTREGETERYVEALCKEITFWGEEPPSLEPVETLYFGGGTPSRLTLKEMEKILRAIERSFRTSYREVTVELNPDDASREYLRGLREMGVNRVSMGVQTFHEERLVWMNRSHSATEAHQALERLSTTGFDKFTADLIYGSPGQTLEELESDLNQLLSYDPPHLSAYSLTIEPGTRLGKQVELGRLTQANDEEVGRQMEFLSEWLQARGLQAYEVSNFSKPGREALHNRNYWNHTPYLGLGPGAHSLWLEEGGGWRWSNERDLRGWQSRLKDGRAGHRYQASEWLEPIDLARERLMLAVRTREGVPLEELRVRYGYTLSDRQQEWLAGQRREGTVIQETDRIALSARGRPLADHLVVELLSRES